MKTCIYWPTTALAKLSLCFIVMVTMAFSPPLQAQGTLSCGTISQGYNSGSVDPSNPSTYSLDRFGNMHGITGGSRSSNCTAGYFELDFPDNFNAQMEETTCRVFQDLSNWIPQRTLTDNCGNTLPNENVFIDVLGITTAGIGGTGTPNYSYPVGNGNSCRNVILSRPYIKINGGTLHSSDPQPDGILELNTEANWYFGNGDVPVNQYDLYTVVLHEALHILGFAGTGSDNIATLWDQHLFVVDSYQGGGSNTQSVPVNVSDCLQNCWDLNSQLFSDFGDLEDMLVDNCTGVQDIVFGATGIAAIAGGGGSLLNAISHLHESCNGQNENFVMAPVIYSGPNTEMRQISNTELDILCELGYQTTSCNGCYAIATEDKYIPRDESELDCCVNRFYSCAEDDFFISFDDLLCNDISSDILTITDVWIPNSGQLNILTMTDGILLSNAESREYLIRYTVQGCGCKMHNTSFTVKFETCPDCETPSCDNLICNGTFGSYESEGRMHFGFPFKYTGTFNNSPDIVENINTGNTFLFMANYPTGNESAVLELQDAIDPNCTFALSLDAFTNNSTPSTIAVWGSEFPPCDVTDVFVNYGCVSTQCTDYLYDPFCIGTITMSNSGSQNNPNWINYPIPNWTNNTNTPINYIILSPSGVAYVDNIVATKSCVDSDFTFTVDCSEVTFTSLDENPTHQHYWNFGDGAESNNPNPIHVYANSGTYTVTHTVNDDCATETTVKTVTILDLSADPSFTYSQDCGVVDFLSGVTGTHFWDFGDGSTSTNVNPQHTYALAGNYPVTHTVTDECGTNTFVFVINVLISTPDPRFTFTVRCNEVTFGSIDNSQLITHQWDFGDGNTSTEVNPVHIYATAGTYIVTHTTTNGCGTTSDVQQVIIDLTGCVDQCECPDGSPIIGNGGVINLANTILNNAQNETVGGCISIDGTLLIQQDYTFDGVEFVMNPGSKITIDGNELRLEIVNSNLHGCTEMWQGITLENGGELDFQKNIITNAIHAIEPIDDGLNPAVETEFRVNDNQFIENYIGIYTDNLPDGQFRYVGRISGNRHSGNTFSCPNELLPPYAGQFGFAGIRINSTEQFYFGDNGEDANYFSGTDYGINAFRCYYSKFYNGNYSNLRNRNVGIKMGNCFAQNQAKNNVMTGMRIGILGGSSTFDARDNDIQGIVGIESQKGYEVTIYNNDIDVGPSLPETKNIAVNIRYHQNVPGLEQDLFVQKNDIILQDAAVGVEVFKSNAFALIEDNNILTDNYLNNSTPAEGVLITNSDGQWIVRGNEFNDIGATNIGTIAIQIRNCVGVHIVENEINTDNAMQPKNQMTAAINISKSPGTNLCCNNIEFSDGGVNFYDTNNAGNLHSTDFGTGVGTALGLRLSPVGQQKHKGNNWDWTHIIDAFHHGPASWVNGANPINAIDADPSSITNVDPVIIVTDGDPEEWFPISPAPEAQCATSQSSFCGIPVIINGQARYYQNEIDPIDEAVSANFTNSTFGHLGSYFEAQRYLYGKLNNNPGLLAGANRDIQDFYSYNLTSNLGNHFNATQDYLQTLTFDVNFKTMHLAMNNILEDIESLENILTTATPSEIPVLEQQIVDLRGELKILAVNYFWKLESQKQKVHNYRAQAEAELDQIQNPTLPELNRKQMLSILMKSIAFETNVFNLEEKQSIVAVSDQCPLDGGSGVYIARSLRTLFENVEYPLFDDCAGSRRNVEPESDPRSLDGNYIISPNPSNGEVQIISNESSLKNTQVEIYSMNGTLMNSFELKGGEAKMLNLNFHAPGVYFCKFYDTQQLITTKKLVVIK